MDFLMHWVRLADMRQWRKGIRVPIAVLAVAVAIGSCGGSDESNNSEVTLTIGSRAIPEQEVLGHIYAEALKRVGYKVRKELEIADEIEATPLEALKIGLISGYPEHLNTLVRLLRPSNEEQPTDLQQAYEVARGQLGDEDLTAFPPAPYSRNTQIVVLRRTADKHDLKKVSDLKGKTEKMTVTGPAGCHPSPYCLGGLEQDYAIAFRGFIYEEGPTFVGTALKTSPYRALETGYVDAAFLVNTDGKLSNSGKFAIPEDDKQILPAGNPVFVASKKVVEEAGEDFEETVVAVQKGLDLPVVQRLVAEVELESKDPAQVAARYLDEIELPS
jgi:osmoprotectant transport system substrate-binding protein